MTGQELERIRVAAREAVACSRREQDLPPHITDPEVLARAVTILNAARSTRTVPDRTGFDRARQA